MAFTFAYRLSGGAPTIQDLTFKDTETITKGDLVNLETGEIDLGATNDTAFVGVALETKAGTDSTTKLKVITDFDAIYSVVDNNARVIGSTLDISGATGAQTVATSSNADFLVVADSSATEPTLVRINTGEHWLNQ
jgi:methionine aminopeptidase